MRIAAIVLVAMGIAWEAPAFAESTATASVAAGLELFHQGEFEACIRVLTENISHLRQPEERARAHLFVGLAQAVLGQWSEARASFRRALIDDAQISPDDRRIPPGIVAAFEDVRSTIKGWLIVESPKPSVVFIDRVEVGRTPFKQLVAIGRHRVRVLSADAREEAIRENVLVHADQTTELEVTLVPRPGELSLESYPTGADVWLDDRSIGRTPIAAMRLAPGPATLIVRMAGYQDTELDIEVPPAETLALEVVLQLENARELAGEAPFFGLDRREGVDRWAFDVGFGLGGIAPLSSSLEAAESGPQALSGGMGFAFELGFSAFDLIELSGVFGVETFGPAVEYFSQMAPSSGPTEFVFQEGTDGAMHMRLLRAGLHGRVVLARFGRLRAFAGLGWYTLPSAGEITHYAPETSNRAGDDFFLSAELSGTAITPSAGAKISLFEGGFRKNFIAVDLVIEGRLELMSWESPKISTLARSAAGATRADAARAVWARSFAGDPASVGAGLLVWIVTRI